MDTVIFRWFNRIRTAIILGQAGLFTDWDSEYAYEILKDVRPVSTGSYIIKSPDGKDKASGICWCIDNVWKERETSIAFLSQPGRTLFEAHKYLMRYAFMGSFMAYEVVTDLRHTFFLRNAPDIYRWANAGPGAKRGLNRAYDYPVKYSLDAEDANEMMRELLRLSPRYLESHVPPLEMRDIEHSLCEFDKYERTRLKEGKPRQKYEPFKVVYE
jgi:hypothetical protein